MKDFSLSKEVLVLLIPFLFTSTFTFFSNGYDYMQRSKEVISAEIENKQHLTTRLSISNDFLKDHSAILDNVTNRANRIVKLYNGVLTNKKLSASDKLFLHNSLLEVSEDLGDIEPYFNYELQSTTQLKALNSFLLAERNLLKLLIKNKTDDSTIYEYTQKLSTITKNLMIILKLDGKMKKIENWASDEKTSKAKSYRILAAVNFGLGSLMFSLFLLLVVYAITKRKFS